MAENILRSLWTAHTQSPGQFEGQPGYVPYFWSAGLDGGADREIETPVGFVCGFDLDEQDIALWPELAGRTVFYLRQTGDGRVVEVTEAELAEMQEIGVEAGGVE